MRYLRLYANFLRFSFSKAMEFRLDFFFRFGMDVLWYGVQIAFFELLFLQTDHLVGWNHDQIRIFVASMFVADAVNMTVFASNMWMLPLLVNRGDLDYYLVRPVSSLFFLSLREFAANSFLNLLLAIGVLLTFFHAYPEAFTIGRLLLYAAGMCLGFFLAYVMNLLFIIPVFWMHNAAGLREIWFGLGNFSNRPDTIFEGWTRRVLTTVLPLLITISFPVRMLFADEPLHLLGHMALVTAGLFSLTLWLWRLALRTYSSASS